MIEGIDFELWLDTLDYMILSSRQNMRWLMQNVTVERDDNWRDRKFDEMQTQIATMVAEREVCLKEMGRADA